MSDKRDIGLKTQVEEATGCTRCNHKRKPRDKPHKRSMGPPWVSGCYPPGP